MRRPPVLALRVGCTEMNTGFGSRDMHGTQKPIPRAAILEHELSELRVHLERYAGVLLNGSIEALTGSIAEYLESRRLASVPDLLARLCAAESECDLLLETLLDGETGFFRFPSAFEFLQNTVLPEIRARKSEGNVRSLRIWSAGCSTGEEPYSIAMSVCQAVDCGGGGWNIQIFASDIRRHALETAERGLYPQKALAHLPRSVIQPYFAKVGEHLLVKPRLRNLVTFTPMNLANPVYIGRFDCIFCMDVMRHFSVAQRTTLAQRLHLYLEPGGYLFLGKGEKLPAVEGSFLAEPFASFAYRKPLVATAKAGK